MARDNFCWKLARDALMLATFLFIVHAPILELLSIDSGDRAHSQSYIPRSIALMWTCASDGGIFGDMTRISAGGIYASREYFCNGTATRELCALARATYGCGATKVMTDILFVFTLIATVSGFAIARKTCPIGVVIAGTLCAIFALTGIATMTAQVVAVRAYDRATFSAGFGSVFAASCVELAATIAIVGAYARHVRRAQT
jgi:hypothetical protein